MSLRGEALEAMEIGISKAWPIDKFKPTEAEFALDALLGFLTEHTEEWFGQAANDLLGDPDE